MATKVFLNLPVKDLKRSMEFFVALGYSFNPQFTDDAAACLVISEEIYGMLLTHEKFEEFTPKPISDSSRTTEVVIALSCDSRADVDKIADKAMAAGASKCKDPTDYGFMYLRSFQDLDGHLWEYFWMDPANIQK